MGNKVYFSHFHAGHIFGMERALSLMTEMFLGRESPYRRTFFSAIVQGGISQLLLSSSLADELTGVPFIQNRLKLLPKDNTNVDWELISDVFQNHLPEDYRSDGKYDEKRLNEYLAKNPDLKARLEEHKDEGQPDAGRVSSEAAPSASPDEPSA